jgi:hypothetical protein
MATLTATELLNCNFIPDFIPPGTITTAENATAPTSWTKLTTHNDKALRVVTGTVSSTAVSGNDFTQIFSASRAVQGSTAPQTTGYTVTPASALISIDSAAAVFPTGNTAPFSLLETHLPAHAHNYTRHRVQPLTPGGTNRMDSVLGNLTSTNTGGGSSHNHGISVTPHGHTLSNQQHAHGITDPGHNHTFTGTAQNFAVNYVDIILIQKN